VFDFNDLMIFKMVVDYKSISYAAKMLDCSQAKVTQTINTLERNLDAKLLNRSVRPLQLTLAGKIFYKKSCYIISQIKLLEYIGNDPSCYRKIKVGVDKNLLGGFSEELFYNLNTYSSKIVVDMYSGSSEALKNQLCEDGLDLLMLVDDNSLEFKVDDFLIKNSCNKDLKFYKKIKGNIFSFFVFYSLNVELSLLDFLFKV
jgi:DNA-binding transcriptional LysR family regulator